MGLQPHYITKNEVIKINEQTTTKVKYDKYGRMFYNPQFHANNGKRWTAEDVQYLIDWYCIAGPQEISFALERTEKTVQAKAVELRRKGLMPKSNKCIRHKKIVA